LDDLKLKDGGLKDEVVVVELDTFDDATSVPDPGSTWLAVATGTDTGKCEDVDI
jgi:hypothetical protein